MSTTSSTSKTLSDDPDCSYEIDPGVFSCYGYVNVAKARIKGVEFEGSYDAGGWFFGASATVLEGKDVDTDEDLYSILPAQVMLTAGARFFDQKLTIAPNWRYVKPRRRRRRCDRSLQPLRPRRRLQAE